MTIRVKKDRIEFVSDEGTTFTLRETGDGFAFDGVIEGTNIFQDGFQGTIAGFTSGGYIGPGAVNTIDKFPFATDTNATDVGDITQAIQSLAGQSSTTHGYSSGGGSPESNTIDKFPFSTNSNSTDVGDLSQARDGSAGQSSTVSGYSSGGRSSNPPAVFSNTIDKFPFSTDTNASDVGDLTQVRGDLAGQSSFSSGYASGGIISTPPSVVSNTIDKFPFATNTNATDVGDLTQARQRIAGQSSTTHGYNSGGVSITNIIEKFPFATDTNATDVGDLITNIGGMAGQSSTMFGYSSGGQVPSASNIIQKFPFSADSNATDVGDLTQSRLMPAGQQD
jgi:hypothetical protein